MCECYYCQIHAVTLPVPMAVPANHPIWSMSAYVHLDGTAWSANVNIIRIINVLKSAIPVVYELLCFAYTIYLAVLYQYR